jgi:hypothetical protein
MTSGSNKTLWGVSFDYLNGKRKSNSARGEIGEPIFIVWMITLEVKNLREHEALKDS